MSKLTPPSPQNRAKLKAFILSNPTTPKAKQKLQRIVEDEVDAQMRRPRPKYRILDIKTQETQK